MVVCVGEVLVDIFQTEHEKKFALAVRPLMFSAISARSALMRYFLVALVTIVTATPF